MNAIIKTYKNKVIVIKVINPVLNNLFVEIFDLSDKAIVKMAAINKNG